MKKLFAVVLLLALFVGMFPMAIFAASGDLRDYTYRIYEHKRLLERECKDEYALSYYSLDFDVHDRLSMTSIYDGEAYKTMHKVTAGITDKYEKAKAVAQWLFANVVENTCEAYTVTTMHYFRLADFPAKEVGGEARGFSGWDLHRWNHVFVDGRWVFVDTMVSKFDPSIEEWSRTHILSPDSLDTD